MIEVKTIDKSLVGQTIYTPALQVFSCVDPNLMGHLGKVVSVEEEFLTLVPRDGLGIYNFEEVVTVNFANRKFFTEAGES